MRRNLPDLLLSFISQFLSSTPVSNRLLVTALIPFLFAPSVVNAQTPAVTLIPFATTVRFPATPVGSASSAQNLIISVNSNLTISSMSVPASLSGRQEFSLGTIAGCAIDGVTVNATGTVCNVPVTFRPALAGVRQIPLVISTSQGSFQFGLQGVGQAPQLTVSPGLITTVAGNGTYGDSGDGGPAIAAEIAAPSGLAVDAFGNLYIADNLNHRIRMVNAATGIITTAAGVGSGGYTGDGGQATSAQLNHPNAVRLDAAGNVYISDSFNNVVRRVDTSGVITTVVGNGFGSGGSCVGGFSGDGGPAISAELYCPNDIAFEAEGNLYIADMQNNRIRKVDALTHVISTVAGDGSFGYTGDGGLATNASFRFALNITVDDTGNLYISDSNNYRIRRVNATTGIITTAAGNGFGVGGWGTGGYSGDGGPATDAEINTPDGLASDAAGNLYIADYSNMRIREVDASSNVITTVAGGKNPGSGGDGGPATSAQLYYAQTVTVDAAGNLIIADSANHRIRRVSADGAPVAFPRTNVGSQSATQTVTFRNIGNQPLTFSGISTTSGFPVDNSATTCSTSSPLPSGASCQIGIAFAPAAAGTVSGTLTVSDDALNVSGATQKVQLSAVAAPQPQLQLSADTSSLNLVAGQQGTVQFAVNSSAPIASAVTFACSGLPPGSSCSFSPTSLTTLPATVTLTVATTQNTATLHRTSVPWISAMVLLGFFLLPTTTNCRWKTAALAGMALVLALGAIGCGGSQSSGGSIKQSTYLVTVTASSTGAVQGVATIEVKINQ